jgi:hypothetical protein
MAYKKGAKEAIANRQPLPERSFEPDLNDGKEWSEDDIADLKVAWKQGEDLEELCRYLCRADYEDVAKKCSELGLDLKYQSRRKAGRLQGEKMRGKLPSEWMSKKT